MESIFSKEHKSDKLAEDLNGRCNVFVQVCGYYPSAYQCLPCLVYSHPNSTNQISWEKKTYQTLLFSLFSIVSLVNKC